jgi:cell shape-determining protein MreC
VMWRIVDRFITRANMLKVIEKIDDKTQAVKDVRVLVKKRDELKRERRDLEKDKKISELEDENERLKEE